MNINNIGSIIENPQHRKWAYNVVFVLVFALGAVGVGFGAAETAAPAWFAIASAVVGYISGALNGMAGANTPPKEVPEDTAESIAKRIEES